MLLLHVIRHHCRHGLLPRHVHRLLLLWHVQRLLLWHVHGLLGLARDLAGLDLGVVALNIHCLIAIVVI